MSFPIGHDSSMAMQQEPIYWSYRFHFFVWPIFQAYFCNREYPHNSYGLNYMVHFNVAPSIGSEDIPHCSVPFFSTVNRWGKHLHEMLGNGAARYVHAGFPCFFFFVLGVSYLVGGIGGGGLGNLGELRLGEGSHSSLSSPRFPKPPPPWTPP